MSRANQSKLMADANREHASYRLQDELDKLLKIFSHMRQCFESEMTDGLGYKKIGITPVLLKNAVELGKLMTSLVDSKIRYDKAKKQLADDMTPEEEELACLTYLKSLSGDRRQAALIKLRDWMKLRNEPYPTILSPE